MIDDDVTQFTMVRLQDEQRAWQRHNFPDRTEWFPLCGLAEELGELAEAIRCGDPEEGKRREQIADAVADALIFASDYASAMGWDMQTLWDRRVTHERDLIVACRATIAYGRLAHHHLKAAQNIRGGREVHLEKAREALVFVFAVVDAAALFEGIDAEAATRDTWERVKRRDWRADPDKGGELASFVEEVIATGVPVPEPVAEVVPEHAARDLTEVGALLASRRVSRAYEDGRLPTPEDLALVEAARTRRAEMSKALPLEPVVIDEMPEAVRQQYLDEGWNPWP